MASFRHLTAIAASASVVSALWTNGSVIAPCDSPIYCHGDILEEIQLAHVYEDSKTFVDMPALKPIDEIREAFDKLDKPLKNNSALNDFLHEYFGDAGSDLEELDTDDLETDPKFLDDIDDAVIKEFVEKVIDIWPDLTRRYNGSNSNCTDCPSSFIPTNRTFVVAGGRFREFYYWDSYWILEGLLRTGGSFIKISKNIIENMLDMVDDLGFVPNGARVYYKNRSQPPLLSRMVHTYVTHTNDTEILDRALPLLVKEHEFWMTNRTVEIEKGDKTYTLNQYNVENTQPRPESYLEDYETATNTSYYAESGIIYPQNEKLNDTARQTLYRNLATGAESGLDYTVKASRRPEDAARDVYFPLRYLNIIEIVPIDLNSILYGNEIIISEFYNQTGNDTAAKEWADVAKERSEAMHALLWNETLFSYFDYNMTSGEQERFWPTDNDTQEWEKEDAPKGQQILFSVSQLYPFWTGAAPEYLKNNPLAVQKAYSRVTKYLEEKPGGIPVTNFESGQQWDQPNVWPPLQHILMAGLQNTPATFGEDDPAYKSVHNTSLTIAQRYLDSTFCTWYATGGSTSDTPQLKGLSDSDVGIMFEKYADNAINTAGGGGEYEVVEGFGWTNGVLIWAADEFKNELKRPDCGDIEAAETTSGEDGGKKKRRSALEIAPGDARRTKRFGKRARGQMKEPGLY